MILHLTAKDLRRRIRSPLGTILLLIFPVAFAVLIGLTFGREDGLEPVKLAMVDFDGGFFSRIPANAFNREEMNEFFQLVMVSPNDWKKEFGKAKGNGAAEGEDLYKTFMGFLEQTGHYPEDSVRVERDHSREKNPAEVWISELLLKSGCAALLIIPKGFDNAVIQGNDISLLLFKNPSQTMYPVVAESLADIMTLILSIGSEVLREPLRTIEETVLDEDGFPSERSMVEVTRLTSRSLRRIKKYIMPEGGAFGAFKPLITISTYQETAQGKPEEETEQSLVLRIILMVFPGIAVIALMMIADLVMRDIRIEYEQKTLVRQFVAPVSSDMVIAGKMLAAFLISFIALVILACLALLWKPGPVSLAGVALLSFSFVLAAVGLSALIYSLAGSARQGAVISSVILMPMGFLGGSFVPLQAIKASFLGMFAPFTLNYWAVDGYLKLLSEKAGPSAILLHCGILLAVGVVLLFSGTLVLRHRIASKG